MVIHVVEAGENISSIAKKYGVSVNKLISDNELKTPNDLVIGQTIVILYPKNVYTVKEGDTLESIAKENDISVINILQNNPSISGSDLIYPGQEIVISYEGDKLGSYIINGYTYPSIDKNTLAKTLPYLTYLTIFTYGITREGELITIDDNEIIAIAKNYGVAPIMLISTLTEDGVFSNELASLVLNNEDIQNNLIDNILENLKAKGYYGLDVDFEFIYPEDAQKYVDFLEKLTAKLNAEGFIVLTALAPKVSSDQKGLLYEGHDYAGVGKASNEVLLMTYEWGYTYGPPMAVAPINKVREVLDYGVSVIPSEKILMGIPNYGYDWTLPYVKGVSKAKSMSNVEAVDLAKRVGAIIKFDTVAQSPYFTYVDQEGINHEVWFEDARSIKSKAELLPEYNFRGASYWNIMKYFPQNWLVINNLFDIVKV